MRWARFFRQHGLTQDDYKDLLRQQDYRCALCLTIDPGRGNRNLSVDHDHVTGKVRGLLCIRCNAGLGMFCDNTEVMEKAIAYIHQYRSEPIRKKGKESKPMDSDTKTSDRLMGVSR